MTLMVDLSDILEDAKLAPRPSFLSEIPAVTSTSSLPVITIPTNIEELNTILSSSSLPSLSPNDSIEAKIHKLLQLKESGCFPDLSLDPEALLEKAQTIARCIEDERECDNLEIELANLHTTRLTRYNNKSIEELKGMAQDLRTALQVKISEREYAEILRDLHDGGPSAALRLSFLRDKTEGMYWKELSKDVLAKNASIWCQVVLIIIENDTCQISDLERKLSVDRVSLLKIIYNLSSKNILLYDRHSDSISLYK